MTKIPTRKKERRTNNIKFLYLLKKLEDNDLKTCYSFLCGGGGFYATKTSVNYLINSILTNVLRINLEQDFAQLLENSLEHILRSEINQNY